MALDESVNQSTKFDLTSFTKAQDKMIATNDRAYGGMRETYRTYVQRTREYTLEEIARIVESGSLVEQQRLSRNYFYKDGYYKQILTYYATLLKYVGLLIPNPINGKDLSAPHIQKRYYNAVDFIEKLDLPAMLTNCALRAMIDGCYYGMRINSDKNGFTLIDLPAQYCCTRFKDIYGNDLIEFDLSYFNTIPEEEAKQAALAAYPKEVMKAYKQFISGKRISKWYVVPSDIGVCFPIFDGRPFFLSVIPATIRYDEAVEGAKERDAEEVKKIIVQKIPHLTDGRLVFEPEEATEIHEGTVGMLRGNKNISVLTTYADVDAIKSDTVTESTDKVLQQFEKNIYAQAGVSGEVFSADTGSAIETAGDNDLAFVMYLANKFSTYLTNIVNTLFSNSNINFKYSILPVSYYNTNKYIDNTFKLVNSGYSFLLPALALGLTQKDLGNVKDLENNLLQLGDKLKPLQTSYTQSTSSGDGSDAEGGRPSKEAIDKQDTTIQKEESL